MPTYMPTSMHTYEVIYIHIRKYINFHNNTQSIILYYKRVQQFMVVMFMDAVFLDGALTR